MNIKEYIASGLLEEFVLGLTLKEESEKILLLCDQYKEIREEVAAIEKALTSYSSLYAVSPPPAVKKSILNAVETIDLLPPKLTPLSKVSDFDYWLGKVEAPAEFESAMHIEVIEESEDGLLAIAWAREGEVPHLHTNYTEKFLVVEGACRATFNGKSIDYGVGDYIEFPINSTHGYEITSSIPMKVIAHLDYKAAA